MEKKNNERERDTASLSFELHLLKAIVSAFELLFPPVDAPVEVLLEAEARLRAMSGKELSSVINAGLRTLTETGRHRRLLAGQSTAMYARADVPDVYIPETPEEARVLEQRSRRAQKALRAAAEGLPLPEGCVISPRSAELPMSSNAPDTGVCPERLTKEEPDVGL